MKVSTTPSGLGKAIEIIYIYKLVVYPLRGAVVGQINWAGGCCSHVNKAHTDPAHESIEKVQKLLVKTVITCTRLSLGIGSGDKDKSSSLCHWEED